MVSAFISEEYRELNRQLHESRSDYGTSGIRYAMTITQLLIDGGYSTVLDYGCGKGTLKTALGLEGIVEYDPAVPGKDSEPAPAALVICTDVLEHIEPDRLDAVLDHLRFLARPALFVAVSTRPANKELPDGRNAHLIVQPAEWWRAKFEEKFKINSWTVHPDEVVAVLGSKRGIGHIHAKSAMADDDRYQQAKINLPKTANRLTAPISKRPIGRVILCAYGPSLTHTWDSIEKEREAYIASQVVSVSGAHDFLIERGVIPDYHVEVDPREHKSFFTKNSHPDVHYLIASCCHPRLIDQLLDAGRNVTLFNVYNGERDLDILRDFEPDGFLLSGGGSVGLRAFNLFYALGYRSFSLRGMDSSYDANAGGQHAGVHTGKVHSEIDVQCGDRWFKSSFVMIAYARFFFANYRQLSQISKLNGEEADVGNEHIQVDILGDGLLAAMASEILAGRVEPEEAA